jgi:hypothetical protein
MLNIVLCHEVRSSLFVVVTRYYTEQMNADSSPDTHTTMVYTCMPDKHLLPNGHGMMEYQYSMHYPTPNLFGSKKSEVLKYRVMLYFYSIKKYIYWPRYLT